MLSFHTGLNWLKYCFSVWVTKLLWEPSEAENTRGGGPGYRHDGWGCDFLAASRHRHLCRRRVACACYHLPPSPNYQPRKAVAVCECVRDWFSQRAHTPSNTFVTSSQAGVRRTGSNPMLYTRPISLIHVSSDGTRSDLASMEQEPSWNVGTPQFPRDFDLFNIMDWHSDVSRLLHTGLPLNHDDHAQFKHISELNGWNELWWLWRLTQFQPVSDGLNFARDETRLEWLFLCDTVPKTRDEISERWLSHRVTLCFYGQ